MAREAFADQALAGSLLPCGRGFEAPDDLKAGLLVLQREPPWALLRWSARFVFKEME